MYCSLHKSVRFNKMYLLLREASISVVKHLKRGVMTLFLHIFKGGQKTGVCASEGLMYHNERRMFL